MVQGALRILHILFPHIAYTLSALLYIPSDLFGSSIRWGGWRKIWHMHMSLKAAEVPLQTDAQRRTPKTVRIRMCMQCSTRIFPRDKKVRS